ncbi:hypothetical protein [Thiosocius teredinicola]|uniref:hypothetical protein n=1 Tax=Thiosocius teredinicola TaxID=1973002 RepID=UPI000990F5B8
MEYKIEPIGAEFSNKAISQLGNHFTAHANAGYKLHSVFQAQQAGCLSIGSPTITYFAIYVKE